MKTASNKSQNPYQQSQSSVIFENDNVSNVDLSVQVASNEEKSYINNLKNMIQKLQTVHIIRLKKRMHFEHA